MAYYMVEVFICFVQRMVLPLNQERERVGLVAGSALLEVLCASYLFLSILCPE